jgi:hypothetical protein
MTDAEVAGVPWWEKPEHDGRIDRKARPLVLLEPTEKAEKVGERPPTPDQYAMFSGQERLDEIYIDEMLDPFLDREVYRPDFTEERNQVLCYRVALASRGKISKMFQRFQRKRAALNNGGAFAGQSNDTRTKSLFRVEVHNNLKFEAVVADVANQMVQEAQDMANAVSKRAKGLRPKVDDFLTIALESDLGRKAGGPKKESSKKPVKNVLTGAQKRKQRQQMQWQLKKRQQQLAKKQAARIASSRSVTLQEGRSAKVEEVPGSKSVAVQEGSNAKVEEVGGSKSVGKVGSCGGSADDTVPDGSGDAAEGKQPEERQYGRKSRILKAGVFQGNWKGLMLIEKEQEEEKVEREPKFVKLPRLTTNLRDWLAEKGGTASAANLPPALPRPRVHQPPHPPTSGPVGPEKFRHIGRGRREVNRARYLGSNNPDVQIVPLDQEHANASATAGADPRCSILNDYRVPATTLKSIQRYMSSCDLPSQLYAPHAPSVQLRAARDALRMAKKVPGRSMAHQSKLSLASITNINGLDFFAFGPVVTPRVVMAEVDSRLELIEAMPYHRLQSDVKHSFLRSIIQRKSQLKTAAEAKEGEIVPFVPHDLEWLQRTPSSDSPLMRLNVATDSMTMIDQLTELYAGGELSSFSHGLMARERVTDECPLPLNMLRHRMEISTVPRRAPPMTNGTSGQGLDAGSDAQKTGGSNNQEEGGEGKDPTPAEISRGKLLAKAAAAVDSVAKGIAMNHADVEVAVYEAKLTRTIATVEARASIGGDDELLKMLLEIMEARGRSQLEASSEWARLEMEDDGCWGIDDENEDEKGVSSGAQEEGNQAAEELVPLQGALSIELEDAWDRLQTPGLSKLSMALKYTTPRWAPAAQLAITRTSALSKLVVAREEKLKTVVKLLGGDGESAAIAVEFKELTRLTEMCKFCCKFLFDKLGDLGSYEGRLYFEKIEQDNAILNGLIQGA